MAFGYEDSGVRLQHDNGRWYWHYSDRRVLPEISGGSDPGPYATLDPEGNLVIPPNPLNPPPTGLPAPQNPPQPPTGLPAPRFWTEEQVNEERERIRREEKDKLYSNKSQTEQALERALAEIENQKTADAKRAKDLADAEAEAQRIAAEAEMTANQRIDALRREQDERNRQFQEELALRDAIMARDSRFHELENYAGRVLAANADNILPQLQDLDDIRADSEEQIDAKVQRLVQKSASVLEDIRGAQSAGQRTAPGVSTFSPAMGPQEQLLNTQKTYTAQELRDMSNADYASIRHLLPTGRSGGSGRGMFD